MATKDEHLEAKKKRLLKPDVGSPQHTDVKKIKSESSKDDHNWLLAEEEEAVKTDPISHLKSFHASCNFLKSTIKTIKDLKTSPKNTAAEIAGLRTDASLHFVHMKKLNRLAHFRCRKVRETTNEAKHKIDQCHLQLQNLLYEAMHLQKEITKCMEFKSKDEEIELVEVEEFYKDAPESISNPSTTKSDPHQQMLARLEWELEQRKQLASELMETKKNKEKISDEIQSKEDYLDTLQPKLTSILQATRPVQDYLHLPYDAVKEEHEKAQYLAMPLYILYMQSSAYREACDKDLRISIQGDVEAAASIGSFTLELDDDSDSEQEDHDKEDSKKRRRKTVESREKEKKSRVLTKHPLSVLLMIGEKDSAELQLTFNYLIFLNIVTVDVKVTPGPKISGSAVSGGGLLDSDLILDELYPDDRGTDSPNPSNNFELKRHGLHEFSTYIQSVGRPYLWCQWMGGLQFLKKQPVSGPLAENDVGDADPGVSRVVKARDNISTTHMQKTITLLRKRLQDRLALLQQLSSLEKSLIPIPPEQTRMFPTKIVSNLSSWQRSTYEDLRLLPQASRFIKAGLVKESDMVFVAVMERATAKMTVQVVLTANCPSIAPLFIIEVLWQTSRTALNDVHIMEMEEEVNVHFGELLSGKSRDHLLASQLQRLLMCMDVYLETDTPALSTVPVEIPKEKIIPRSARGPGRSKPFKYVPELGIFTHRG